MAQNTSVLEKRALNRRTFVASAATTAAAAAAFTIVPRRALGGPGFVPPSERIRVAYVGSGTQGVRQLMQALPKTELEIAAVCDPNRDSQDYIEWGKDEIRTKIRDFLDAPTWGESLKGCRCGRELGRELIEAHYGKTRPSGKYSGCATYADYREMLVEEPDIDAVYIMTPDHLHAQVAVAAMKKGKHVITHKALSNVLDEIYIAEKTASETGLASQMFCSAGNPSAALLSEWIDSGAIGAVREVHNWSSRPFWPQGMTQRPEEKPPIPNGFDWKLWLGPVGDISYHPTYTHAVFRGWYDFGAGALGDMGHYSFHQIFKILKLGSPTSVEASRSQYWEIVDGLWRKENHTLAYPHASRIVWEFPAREGGRPPVSLHWYDGGLRPPTPPELDRDNEEMPEEGMLFVGEKGKILAGFTGNDPRLIPASRMRAFKEPPRTLPRPAPELDQWIRACRGETPSDANFTNILPFTETIALGNIALRVGKKLRWDGKKREFLNAPETTALRSRKYRKGWEL